MSAHFPLRGFLTRLIESRRDPCERLDALHRDMLVTKRAIHEALDHLAARHGIAKADVEHTFESYIDDLLGDVVFHAESNIQREIDADEWS